MSIASAGAIACQGQSPAATIAASSPLPQPAQSSPADRSALVETDYAAIRTAFRALHKDHRTFCASKRPSVPIHLFSPINNFSSQLNAISKNLTDIFQTITGKTEPMVPTDSQLNGNPDSVNSDLKGLITTTDAFKKHLEDRPELLETFTRTTITPLKEQGILFEAYCRRLLLPEELQGHYELKQCCGVGTFANVYLCHPTAAHPWHGTPKQLPDKVVIKKIADLFVYSELAKRTLREIKILRLLSTHPNIVSFKGLLPQISPECEHVSLVFEAFETTLASMLLSKQPFGDSHVKCFLYQILLAVEYMHSIGVVHRDLKPENILTQSDCHLKICDFGAARLIPKSMLKKRSINQNSSSISISQAAATSSKEPSGANQQSGSMSPRMTTSRYRAPEMNLQPREYSTAVDMWSVGCIFAELLSMQLTPMTDRQLLFPQLDTPQTLQKNFELVGNPPDEKFEYVTDPATKSFLQSLPKNDPADFKKKFPEANERAIELLQKLLCLDPSTRFTATQALEHPYLEEFFDPNDRIQFNYNKYFNSTPLSEWDFEDRELADDQYRKLILQEIGSGG